MNGEGFAFFWWAYGQGFKRHVAGWDCPGCRVDWDYQQQLRGWR